MGDAAIWFIWGCFAFATIFFARWIGSVLGSGGDDLMSGDSLMVPDRWDDQQIALGLERLRHRPALLAHYVNSVKDRFIDHQNIKTVRRRTDFLEAKIRALQAGKEYLTLISELKRLRLEEETKDIHAEMARAEALSQQQRQPILHHLRHQLETLQLEQQITVLQQQINEIQSKKTAPPKLSASEERARKRAECQEELNRLQEDKRRAIERAPTEEERIRVANMYDNAIERAYDELSRYL